MATEFLNGLDVRAYTIQANGNDLYPGINGGAYQMLGIYKEIEITVTIEDSDTTPSSQMLKQSRMTGFDWEATAKYMVPFSGEDFSGNPVGLDLLFSGNFNLLMIFQLYTGGPFYSLYGRIKTDTLSISRESITESLSFKNAGPVGNTSQTASSFFFQDGSPLTVSQVQALSSNPRVNVTDALIF